MTSLRMQIVFDVLGRAKDCEDAFVIAHCRNLINADRIGKWNANSWKIVKLFV